VLQFSEDGTAMLGSNAGRIRIGKEQVMNRLQEYFSPLAQLRRELDQAFEEFPEGARAFGDGVEYPPINIWESGDVAFVEAELPGITMNLVDVQVTGSELMITGQRTTTLPEKAVLQRRERPEGRFSRVVTLPWEVDTARVEAKLCDGVLIIQLPKSPASMPRKVKVATT